MKHTVLAILLTLGVLLPNASAHDPSKHKGKPVVGEVLSLAGDGFELKTDSGVVPVTFSSKTKFEHGNAVVDKSHLSKGTRVTVFGTKLPNGDLVAREVLIGTAAAGTADAHSRHGDGRTERGDQAKEAEKATHKH